MTTASFSRELVESRAPRPCSTKHITMQLSQVRLVVQDFPRVFRFYRDVLGLVPQVDDERGPYAKLSFPSGSAAIALQAREHVKAALDALAQPIALASGLTSAILAVHVDSV